MKKKQRKNIKKTKYTQKKMPAIKKVKLAFILFIVSLWVIVAFKFFFLFKDDSTLKNLLSNKTEEEIPVEEIEEEIELVESPALIFFTEYINEMYSDYYNILDVRAVEFVPEDEEFTDMDKFYFVTIEKKLKYTSVFQLPFVSGMKKAVEELGNSKKANRIYNKKTNELKEYIGKKQIEHNIFKVTFEELDNFEKIKIQIATYHDKTSAELLKPPSFEQMIKDGFSYIKQSLRTDPKKISYNNYKAISYSDRHSSNPYKTGINKRCWNKNYKEYENDCANFVSQCLYAGGLKETSKWFPGSFYWIRTGSPKYANISGVSNYMQKIKKFYKTNYSGLSAGGFICLIKESHVVFVSSNDSVTVLFNGHTNDRKRISFPHLNQSEAMYLTPNN